MEDQIMDPFQLAVDGLTVNLEMLKGTIADFSDADIYVRPCPGANHTAWQLGHITGSENWMLNEIDPKAAIKLPDGWEKKFSKENTSKDDPSLFGAKQQILDQLIKVRGASIAWVKTLKPADLDKPAPQKLQRMCPTIGHVLGLLPNHFSMHVGQMQVIRRKLGKPIIF
jgi:DinB superfamily